MEEAGNGFFFFARGLLLRGRTIVGKCLFDFNMSREDVVRQSFSFLPGAYNFRDEP